MQNKFKIEMIDK